MQEFDDLPTLKVSLLYVDSNPNKKGMLTTNRMLIESAAHDKIHFNIRKLETVIGYNSDDKSGLKIWQLIQNPAFVITNALYPDSLNNFLEITKLTLVANNNVVAQPIEQDLPF